MWVPYQIIGHGSGPIYGPLVEFEIIAPLQDPFPTKGLVDSGADSSLLDIAIADELNLPVRKVPGKIAQAAGGILFAVHVFPIQARFGGITFELDARWAALADDEEVRGFNLLGRGDFFQAFKVLFDQQREGIEITPYRKKKY
ncbi:MAG TPA: hypothetical protein VE439_01595 [Anaerolineae bacterium]|jgi:predicted aspartyl protease|nr:hypothetical protein [Anaerolineae bacterium]